ncbi:MAG: molecular chaperone DnaJ [Rhodospirillaceae bacterium]|nr:molecular chaperone DnaJ [Rhodospirillaceae bacterium]
MSKQHDISDTPTKKPDDPPGTTKGGRRNNLGPAEGPALASGKGTKQDQDRDAALAACDHPNCQAVGEFRAPRSRSELTQFFWFCLEHVREYNAAWNYYADMDDAAVEAEIRKDIVWQRPTWPLGTRPGASGAPLHDPLSLLGEGATDARADREVKVEMQNLSSEEREALSVLGLVAPITKADVKHRYKLLAKTLHPDANGGDRKAEDRLKSVNHAYTTLKDSERLT